MIWLLLLYYVVMEVPSGMVHTSYNSGVLRVGDQEAEIPFGHKLVCVNKRSGYLFFKFESLAY